MNQVQNKLAVSSDACDSSPFDVATTSFESFIEPKIHSQNGFNVLIDVQLFRGNFSRYFLAILIMGRLGWTAVFAASLKVKIQSTSSPIVKSRHLA